MSGHDGCSLLGALAPPRSAPLCDEERLGDTCGATWSRNDDPAPSRYARQVQVGSRLASERAVYNFETSVQGWSASSSNDTVARVRGPAYDGAHALALVARASAAGDHIVQVLGAESVPPNTMVSLRLWLPADAPVHSAAIFVKDGEDYRYTASGLPAGQLRVEAWSLLQVQSPSDANFTQAVGLDLTLAGPWCGQVFLDAVSWQGAPTRDLSQSTNFLRVVHTPEGAALGAWGLPTPQLGYEVQLAHIAACGVSMPAMVSGMERIRAASAANTVRMWFLQSAGGAHDWSRFDLAVQHAKANGLRIIATLVNQYGDCEPLVNNSKNIKTVDWYIQGYKKANDGYPQPYRSFARAVAEHYANEETIALWQIGNELSASHPNGTCDAEAASAALRAFADDITRVIRSVDTNHLVSLGTVGATECGLADDGWMHVHAGEVDVTEIHDYSPANQTLPAHLYERVLQSEALHKPIFVGELGVCNNLQTDFSCQGDVTGATLRRRAMAVEDKVNTWLDAGVAGVSLWAYGYDANYSIHAGDPVEAVMREAVLARL